MIKPMLITIASDQVVQGSKVDEDLVSCLSDECQGKLFNLRVRAFYLLEKGRREVTCPYCGQHVANAEWIMSQSAPRDFRGRNEFQNMMKPIPFK